MNETLAWLVRRKDGGGQDFVTTHNEIAGNYAASDAYVVTSLVAAPSTQTAEQVREMLRRFGELAAFNEFRGEAETEEMDALEAQLLALCSHAPEGAPSWEELAEALRDVLNSDEMGFITRMHARNGARALLSRIPKEEA